MGGGLSWCYNLADLFASNILFCPNLFNLSKTEMVQKSEYISLYAVCRLSHFEGCPNSQKVRIEQNSMRIETRDRDLH
jgi:hypothetical protein